MQNASSATIKIGIAANFTANEIREPLSFWFESLEMDVALDFSRNDSIFWQLMNEKTTITGADCAVILIKSEAWCSSSTPSESRLVSQNHQYLIDAIEAAAIRFPFLRVIVISCPSSWEFKSNPQWAGIERELEYRLSSFPGVIYVSSETLNAYYAPEHYAEYFAKTPLDEETSYYSQYGFAAIATIIARKIYLCYSRPRKVIVVDCDNTLWGGVCAEQGSLGVTIESGYKSFQTALSEQVSRGRLLCLCSKNNDDDVANVFLKHPEMILSLDQVVARRVNWLPKYSNLLSIASELGVGVESFLFFDDDDCECKSIESLCKGVKVYKVPRENDKIEAFLKDIWEFDSHLVSDEDGQRLEYYQQNAARRDALKESASYEVFLRNLHLEVIVEILGDRDMLRAEQLMLRVNQFNLNGYKMTPQQMCRYIREETAYSIRVKDRFGDYGMVGVLFYEKQAGSFCVRSLLLSCRALGKGVEQKLSLFITNLAKTIGCNRICFDFAETDKNALIRDFISELHSESERECQIGVAGHDVKVPK